MRGGVQLIPALVSFACFGQPFSPNDAVIQQVMVSVGPGVWAPTNTYAWYSDTNLVGNNGDLISVWVDSSGNGHNLYKYANNDANAPYLTNSILNGHPAVYFDGADRAMTNAFGTTLAQPLTFFLVAKGNVATGGRVLMDGIASTPRIVLAYNSTATTNFTLYCGSATMLGYTLTAITFPVIWTAYASNTVSYLRTNGVDYVKDGTAVGTAGCKGMTIGNRFAALSLDWNGYVCEIIVYNGSMADADRNWVESNLKTKYGL